jgi:hypothetical protein
MFQFRHLRLDVPPFAPLLLVTYPLLFSFTRATATATGWRQRFT